MIGSHIARWADVPELRGKVSNGLCLCLMHDKAFEDGLFTLDSENRVWANSEQIEHNSWSVENIRPYHGEHIDQAPVEPSIEALQHHWDKVSLDPQ